MSAASEDWRRRQSRCTTSRFAMDTQPRKPRHSLPGACLPSPRSVQMHTQLAMSVAPYMIAADVHAAAAFSACSWRRVPFIRYSYSLPIKLPRIVCARAAELSGANGWASRAPSAEPKSFFGGANRRARGEGGGGGGGGGGGRGEAGAHHDDHAQDAQEGAARAACARHPTRSARRRRRKSPETSERSETKIDWVRGACGRRSEARGGRNPGRNNKSTGESERTALEAAHRRQDRLRHGAAASDFLDPRSGFSGFSCPLTFDLTCGISRKGHTDAMQ